MSYQVVLSSTNVVIKNGIKQKLKKKINNYLIFKFNS
jgi:hypothetical protein